MAAAGQGCRDGCRVLVLRVGRCGLRCGGRMSGLPAGAVTFLFSDIEGSTRLVKALRERYSQVIAEYRRLVRAALAAHGGREVDTQGDGFFVAFGGATQAGLCALDIQRALAAHRWTGGAQVRVRIGIHTGQAVSDRGAYTGLAVHRAARICAAAGGGLVLISQATQTLIEDEEEGELTPKEFEAFIQNLFAQDGLSTPSCTRPAGTAVSRSACRPQRLPTIGQISGGGCSQRL
jgi:class 3 adenylate cyclase